MMTGKKKDIDQEGLASVVSRKLPATGGEGWDFSVLPRNLCEYFQTLLKFHRIYAIIINKIIAKLNSVLRRNPKGV